MVKKLLRKIIREELHEIRSLIVKYESEEKKRHTEVVGKLDWLQGETVNEKRLRLQIAKLKEENEQLKQKQQQRNEQAESIQEWLGGGL